MFKTLVSVVILIIPSVICEGWCPYIIRNGIYEGLGIYHRMVGREDHHSYVMFNRFGSDSSEWRFEVKPRPLDIQLIEGTVKPYDTTNIVNRFSTYKNLIHSPIGFEYCDCNLTSYPGRPEINMICTGKSIDGTNSYSDPMFGNRVIMKAQPSVTNDDSVKWIHMYKKADQIKDYDHIIVNGCHPKKEFQSCKAGDQDICQKEPKFVEQMDPKLFKSIEGVVDFNFNKGKSGHLLLFNISGRPKYCFTFEREDLSEKCKSPENMKPLFVECFPLTDSTTINPNNNPTNSPTHKIETKNTMFWIILTIVIITLVVIVVIVGILLYLKKHKRNPNESRNAFNTVSRVEPKTLSSVNQQTSTGSNFLKDSTVKSPTIKSSKKGTPLKTPVKTTQSQAKPSTKATQLPKTSVKPSQSPKI